MGRELASAKSEILGNSKLFKWEWSETLGEHLGRLLRLRDNWGHCRLNGKGGLGRLWRAFEVFVFVTSALRSP